MDLVTYSWRKNYFAIDNLDKCKQPDWLQDNVLMLSVDGSDLFMILSEANTGVIVS